MGLFYCTGWGFGMVLHNSQVAEVLTTREGVCENSIIPDLLQQRLQISY